MKTIQLNLTIEQVNQILEALGNEPFVKVHDLIATIQQQASVQLQEKEKKNPAKGDS